MKGGNMTRKILPLTVAALTGALGFSATPLWSHPQHAQNRDQASMQQSWENRDQANMNGSSVKTAGTEMKSKDVKEVQQALQREGHDPGPINGIMGPETEAALQSFQQSAGLEATGKLNDETMAQLGIYHFSEKGALSSGGRSTDSERSAGMYGESSANSERSSADAGESGSVS
jgi:peptidoglycan hydrolase-like protein with peptidoglycan-binding domain